MGELLPFKEIEIGHGQTTYLFPRSKQDTYLRRFAPERLPNAYKLPVLARKLQTTAEVMRAPIAAGILKVSDVLGTKVQPVYIATPGDITAMKRVLKERKTSWWKPEESALRYPREELLTFYDLAEELDTTPETVYLWVNQHKIKPVQTVRLKGGSPLSLFLKKASDRLLLLVCAPQSKRRDVIDMLADTLDSSPSTVRIMLDQNPNLWIALGQRDVGITSPPKKS